MVAADGATGRGKTIKTNSAGCVICGEKNGKSAQMLEVSLLGVGTMLRLDRDAWPMTKASNK